MYICYVFAAAASCVHARNMLLQQLKYCIKTVKKFRNLNVSNMIHEACNAPEWIEETRGHIPK